VGWFSVCLSAFRFLPQQPIVSSLPLGDLDMGHRALGSRALEQTGGTGERERGERELAAPPRDDKARGRGDPCAQAVEAIHQLTEPSLPETRPQPDDDVRRPVFLDEQMRDAPDCQRREREANPECRVVAHRRQT
jgi:hypothetical protein